MTTRVSQRLPDFPWDTLAPHKQRAEAHPDGIVDLSIGTPVDPTPALVQHALDEAADAPGYPQVIGLPETRQAALDWMARRLAVTGLGLDQVLPTIGSKELVASLPAQLGLGRGDLVVVPEVAYPTYAVGALVAGATVAATDDPGSLDGPAPALVWVNSPANPSGRVWSADHLRALLTWCRERGVLLVSDECYVELAWDPAARPVSVLHPDVCGGSAEGVLAVHSLSKRSNLAGYRCGFVAGDAAVVGELLAVRKHLGLILPAPQQRAMAAALADDDHVAAQHATYAARRALLREALVGARFTVEHSEAGLYLWCTRGDEDCWALVSWFADRGLLVAPGSFYGEAGHRHVRVALTADDERVAAAVARLSGSPDGVS